VKLSIEVLKSSSPKTMFDSGCRLRRAVWAERSKGEGATGWKQRRKEIRLVRKLGPAKGVLVGCMVAAVLWILFGLAVWLVVHWWATNQFQS
jgi:hypothetical protein